VLTQIVVDPTNTILEVDLNTPTTQAFTARGRYADGSRRTSPRRSPGAPPTRPSRHERRHAQHPGIASAGAWVTKIEATKGTVKGIAQLTVVAYRKTGNQTDFFFVLPYNDPAGDQDKPLDFHTDVQSLDVFFAVDVTGSMGGEIANLQTSPQTPS